MRVAFYAPMKAPDHPVPSGDRRVARLLRQALEAAGHEVRLASRLRSWDDGRDPARQARLRRTGERLAARLIGRWRDAPDRPQAWVTYHLYHKAPDWLGPAVADALDIPYVVAEASHAGKQRGGRWAEGYEASVDAIRRADAVVQMSSQDEAGLRQVLEDADRLVYLGPFLDTEPYALAAAARDAARRAIFGDDPGPWLLAVGMMRAGDKDESYRVLAEALARLGHLRWRLAIVGDGALRARVLARFDPDRLLWLGALPPDDLPRVYAAADLYVWPSINEAYGMALLEAQAAGLPAVAGEVRGVPEILAHARTGLLAPAGDAAGFAEAVAALLLAPERRAAYAAAAAEKAASRHGIARAAAVLDEVLQRVRR
jgi:glycosyltransferase involved in cell wall biosynthesis